MDGAAGFVSQSAVPCQGKSRIKPTVPHGQLPAGLSARGKCGVREPLKRLQKYMDQYNIDSEAERTFDQPADDQRFQFKSVHDVEPERTGRRGCGLHGNGTGSGRLWRPEARS